MKNRRLENLNILDIIQAKVRAHSPSKGGNNKKEIWREEGIGNYNDVLGIAGKRGMEPGARWENSNNLCHNLHKSIYFEFLEKINFICGIANIATQQKPAGAHTSLYYGMSASLLVLPSVNSRRCKS